MSKCRLIGVHLLAGCTALAGAAAAAPPSHHGKKHCVVRAEPVGDDASVPAASAEPECYATFADAIFAATGGIILLPENEPLEAQLETLGREQEARKQDLTAASTFVVAVDYQHSNYGGATLTWESTGPCEPLIGWQKPGMPSGWNDILSSTRGYSNCDKNILFEHSNYGGGSMTCRPHCSGVGWMNDRTSSRKWHHLCRPVTGMWSACNASSGCQVCAELVADYPCYFQNHPNCTSDSACGGGYYTCSDACPAPTQADTCDTTCYATASCANAGGGWVSCEGSNFDCFAVDDCYAYCNGQYHFCPNPQNQCPL